VAVAINVRIDAKTGPAQGVHTSPRAVPSAKAPKLPWANRVIIRSPGTKRLPICSQSHAKGRGHSKSAPNEAKSAAAVERSVVWSMPAICVTTLKKTAATVNDTTKPKVMNAGRAAPPRPTDAPRSAGRSGSEHGAATVKTPAKNAKATAAILHIRAALTGGYGEIAQVFVSERVIASKWSDHEAIGSWLSLARSDVLRSLLRTKRHHRHRTKTSFLTPEGSQSAALAYALHRPCGDVLTAPMACSRIVMTTTAFIKSALDNDSLIQILSDWDIGPIDTHAVH
jgi:hypothetical protein